MIRPLKILFVSAEVAPFATVGGLSQVAYFLPRAIKKLGHDIRILLPKFGTINEEKYPLRLFLTGLKVRTDETSNEHPQHLICNIKVFQNGLGEPTIYFLENMEYYEKRANVYGYSDDHIRFALLSRGALEFIKTQSFVPDLIHVNDWHTGYLVNYLRTLYQADPKLKKLASLLSIHNLHQGIFDFQNASTIDFDDGKGNLAPFFSDRHLKQNALKRGIIYADIVNTVSPTYAKEILKPEYGQGLEGLLKEVRTKVFGVLNGLDYQEFNPKTDKLIFKNFSLKNLFERAENKKDLQREFGLPINSETPLLAVSGRLDYQKGLDLIREIAPYLLKEEDIQLVVVGGGDPKYRDFFADLEMRFPKKVGTHLMPNFVLPRKVFAGADIILLPSVYEPGGIVAIEAMRYGCVPVARSTGGLADTVVDFDPLQNQGCGFLFEKFHPFSFLIALTRALETYKNPKVWKGIIKRAMQKDFSWEHSARQYLDLYQRAIKIRKQTLKESPHEAYRTEY